MLGNLSAVAKMGLSRWLEWYEVVAHALIHLLFALLMVCKGVALILNAYFEHRKAEPPKEEVNGPGVGDDLPPIVLVHGIFGYGKGKMGGLSYFGGAENKDERVLVPDLGSLTSIHDRARELFYYLKGGQVDYGEEHSRAAGHSQFGRVYQRGHYPEWDEHHPVHFVGHSAGAQVARLLQQMLSDKAFKGYENTTENWVLSITAISGAFNGSTRTYVDGMQPGDWRYMRPICLLQFCRIGVSFYEWLDNSWLKAFYQFGFDHFNMSWRKTGIWGLVDGLRRNTGPFASADWILPDLTIQGSMRINSQIKTFPNTFYFSYASKRTRKVMGVTVPSGLLGVHPIFLSKILQLSLWKYPSEVELPYKGYRDEDWEDNDGALNIISMTHPHLPVEHPSRFVASNDECWPLEPGIWYYKIVEADHMLFVVDRERGGVQFDLMYEGIFERCRKHLFRRTSDIRHSPYAK